jgi:hypothetical protein
MVSSVETRAPPLRLRRRDDVVLLAAGLDPGAVGEAVRADEGVVPALRQEDRRGAIDDERLKVLRARRRLALLRVADHRLQVRPRELDLLGLLREAEELLPLRADHDDLRLVDAVDEERPHRHVVRRAHRRGVLPERGDEAGLV